MDTGGGLDPDRLLPADPATRDLARALYGLVADAPIISPHGHVPIGLLDRDEAFENPVQLLVRDDHYVTRLLNAAGFTLDQQRDASPREVWRRFAELWHRFDGTASSYWLRDELTGILGVTRELGPETADLIYDEVVERLRSPQLRPRALLAAFPIAVLATTDDPLDDLAAHDRVAGARLPTRVIPTFRPDAYLDPDRPDFTENVERLVAATGQSGDFAGYLRALEARRAHFIEHGAVSADHGVERAETVELEAAEASRLFEAARTGSANRREHRALRAHLLLQMARMSVDDGLVMTIHAGVLRNHSTATFRRHGPDTGHDIPVRGEFTRGLRPLLERFGLARDFHLILFSVDETTYARELAPLAGFYPAVRVGAPWWFLDAPLAAERFRAAVTETAGFYRGSGFIDDTRALLSIPARHEMARRVDAAFLARLTVEGRLRRSDAERIALDLVDRIPREAFKL